MAQQGGGAGGSGTWIKVALGAAGLYVLWRAGVLQRVEPPLHRGPAATPSSAAGAGTPAGSSPATPTPTPTPSTGAPPSGSPTSVSKPTAVILTGPGVVPVGGSITVQAQAYGVGTPVYQFWYYPPGGAPGTATGWVSSGPYGLANTFTVPGSAVAGEYQIVAYARSVNAPAHESAAQRAVYETASNTLLVTAQ